MKSHIKKRSLVVLVVLIVIGCIFGGMKQRENYKNHELEKNLKDEDWIFDHVEISLDEDFGKNIYSVEKDSNISVFNTLYQKVIDEKIHLLLEDDIYTLDQPLFILNPYGTNNLGLNLYFNTNEESEVSYTITVDDENISDFTRTLKNQSDDNYSKNHHYQIIGLVPGYKNTLILTVKNQDGLETKKEYTINMKKVKCKTDTILKTKVGDSIKELTNGLYVLFGLDKAFQANNYIYDNNGILRADLVLSGYRSDRIIFDEENMYYSYKKDGIAKINALGRNEKNYSLNGYEMHHDYVYDEEHHKLLILANSEETKNNTIEDLVISLDLKTGDIEEVIDMKDLLPEMYESATMPESGKNTYGGTGLDWIHLNSLSIVNNQGDIVLSSRELSTIIYISNIYEKPKIKYLISEKEVYQGTSYEDLLLIKKGDFVAQAGQHTITYVEDDSLEDGQYYLEMYNNNYGSANTRKDFPWNIYSGVGTYTEGETSKYYRYLVDEKENTFELVKEFNVPYSSIVSSIQDVEKNYVTSSGKSNCYNEYDKDGDLIKQFNYTSKKYAYRVFKYDFKNIWFD